MTNLRTIFLLLSLLFFSVACQEATSNLENSATTAHTNLYATSVANATRQASNADDRVQIEWFVGLGHQPTEKQENRLHQLANRFNESQNEIWVQLAILPEEDALEHLQTSQTEGQLPDLIGPLRLDAANYFAEDWLDLRPYLTPEHLSRYSEQSLALYDRNGRLEGVPINLYPSFIFYNRTLFDKAGLAYPPQQYEQPYADGKVWDFDKVHELALQLTLDREGNQAGSPDFNPQDVRQFGYINQWNEVAREGLVPFGAYHFLDESGQIEIADAWRTGLYWTYEAMWTHRYYPNRDDQLSDLFANANTFRSGHVAMAHAAQWFTCCLGETNFEWDIAVMPSFEGETTSKLHSDSFRIFEESNNKEATAQFLNWLMTTGYVDLLFAYGGVPAQPERQEFMLEELDKFYPYSVNWQVMLDSLAYADTPHHQAFLPNYEQVQLAEMLFWSLIETDPSLDLEQEIIRFETQLQLIVNSSADN
ncbi:MAG: extracellular solute-binding protein [Chloroflexota bacterium]